jgi:hypothetical protein
MQIQLEGVVRSITEIPKLLEADDKVVLAVIFAACTGSLLMPVLRLACATILPITRVLARLASEILIEKALEISIITIVVWFAGTSTLAAAIYRIAQEIFHF